MISRSDFIRMIRDELRLPLANPDLEADFDQKLSWRSIHVVRLAVAIGKRTGVKVPIADLLRVHTPAEIHALLADRLPEAA